MELIADICVLIDIWRCRKAPQRLVDLRAKAGEASLVVPWIVRAEFLRGARYLKVEPEETARFLAAFPQRELSGRCEELYAQAWGRQRAAGKTPVYPELWVAASALEAGVPLLTRNGAAFQGIAGLEVRGYALLG